MFGITRYPSFILTILSPIGFGIKLTIN